MKNGSVVLVFFAGALLGAVGGFSLFSSTPGQATLLSYEPAPDGRQEILVLLGLGRVDSINYVEAQEDGTAIRVNVSVIHWRGIVPADMKMVYVPVVLQRPLGDRSVLDAAGHPVPLRKR